MFTVKSQPLTLFRLMNLSSNNWKSFSRSSVAGCDVWVECWERTFNFSKMLDLTTRCFEMMSFSSTDGWNSPNFCKRNMAIVERLVDCNTDRSVLEVTISYKLNQNKYLLPALWVVHRGFSKRYDTYIFILDAMEQMFV